MPVTYKREGDIAYITLSRGDSLNAMDRAMYGEANQAFHRFNDDDKAKVAIFCSSCPDAFCAGVDINDVHRALAEEGLGMEELKDHFSLFFEAPNTLNKPVIAAIHGHCIGEGLVMSMYCDLRVGADDASFALPEAAIGVPAINGTIRAVQLIGHGAAMELLLTADSRDAAWALRVGLLNTVVSRDELMPQAEALARRIAANDQAACQIMRKIGERALEEPFDRLVEEGGRMRSAVSTSAMIGRQEKFASKKKR